MQVTDTCWTDTRLLRRAVLILLASCLVNTPVLARNIEDPDEIFYAMLDQGKSFESALSAIEGRFGMAVSAELAAYVCAPEADVVCEGTEIDDTWIEFLDIVHDGATVSEAVEELEDYDYKAIYLTAIASNWCSPEPGLGDGCGGDPFSESWFAFHDLMEQGVSPAEALGLIHTEDHPLISDMIGAAVCGHPDCYADEQGLQLEFRQEPEKTTGQDQQAARPAASDKSTTRRYVGTLKRSRSARSRICGIFTRC